MRIALVIFFVMLISFLIGLGIGLNAVERMDGKTGYPIKITAYSPDPSQTDKTPFTMASGKKASISDLYALKYIAVSPDLKKGLRIRYGDKLVVLVEMEFEVQDITNKKLENTIDLFTRSRQQAVGWGVRRGRILKIKRKIF